MGDNSAIEWTDATWNPVLGCSKVSEGCRNCYAILEAWKKHHHPDPRVRAAYEGLVVKRPDGSLNWTGRVNAIPERLEIPLHWKRPRRIFVNSLSDLFHENVPDDFIDRVFGVMAIAKHHSFQVLTKRPERMQAYLTERSGEFGYGARSRIWWAARHFSEAVLKRDHYDALPVGKPGQGPEGVYVRDWPLPNVWLGTSTEDQQTADARIPHLLNTPAAVRFISAEPLLGPITFGQAQTEGVYVDWLRGFDGSDPPIPGLDWVIAGGESRGEIERRLYAGSDQSLSWVRSIRAQCVAAGVAFHFKQWGGGFPKQEGRTLDGRTWDQFPAVAAGAAL